MKNFSLTHLPIALTLTIVAICVFFLLSFSGCNTQRQATKFIQDKCADSSIQKQAEGSYKISIHCTELYNTAKVKEYLPVGKIEYNVSEGELSIVGVSRDSIPQILDILRAIQKGIRK